MRFELRLEEQETTWHVTIWGQNQWRRGNSRQSASGDQELSKFAKKAQCEIRSEWRRAQAPESHADRMTVLGQVVGETDSELETCSQEVLHGNNCGRNAGSNIEWRKEPQRPQRTPPTTLSWDGPAPPPLVSDPWEQHMELCKVILFQIATQSPGPPARPRPGSIHYDDG